MKSSRVPWSLFRGAVQEPLHGRYMVVTWPLHGRAARSFFRDLFGGAVMRSCCAELLRGAVARRFEGALLWDAAKSIAVMIARRHRRERSDVTVWNVAAEGRRDLGWDPGLTCVTLTLASRLVP